VGACIRPQYFEELGFLAKGLKIPLLIQPRSDSSGYGKFIEQLSRLNPDLIWINSYSMLLRQDVLSKARLGAINIHGALLPRNRGANPIQWAIINGESETGVTLHEADRGADTGPIIDQRSVPILFEDTWIDVRDRLVAVTEEIIVDNLPKILSGNWVSEPQDEDKASSGFRRTPEDSQFQWTDPAIQIYNKIRALVSLLPSAFYVESGKKRKIDSFKTIWQVTALKDANLAKNGGVLYSDRLRLRALGQEDATLLHESLNDREPPFGCSFSYPMPELDQEAGVDSMMATRSDLVIFVIEELRTNEVIGTCQLFNIDWTHRSAELQIQISPLKLHDKGYRTEAVNLLCEFGFADLELRRIVLHVVASDQKAIESFCKCGFVREGISREAVHIGGKWKDALSMAKVSESTKGGG